MKLHLEKIKIGATLPQISRGLNGKMKWLFIIILALICICCTEKNPINDNELREAPIIHTLTDSTFAFYFLNDPNIKIKQILNSDFDNLELEKSPWLKSSDINFYDWSSHCIYLKKDKSYYFPSFESFNFESLYKLSWIHKPLLIVAGNKRCYPCYFFSVISSDRYPYPYILDYDIIQYPKNVIHLEWPYTFAADIRDNKIVKEVLSDHFLLRDGIDIKIDSLWIENADTATVRYKITITNNDSDNLYIIDPDKTGTNLFHYFNNGPVFFNSTNNSIYGSTYKKIYSLPLETFEHDWFIKIESKKAITRIISLKGYPYFPSGNYYCVLNYTSPNSLYKKKLQLADGRYWVGPTRSEIVGFDWSNTSNANSTDLRMQSSNMMHKF